MKQFTRVALIFLFAGLVWAVTGHNTESSALGKRVISSEEQEVRQIAIRDIDSALETLDGFIEKSPENDELVRLKGDLLLKADRKDDAMEAYRKALEMNDRSKTALIGVGKVQMAMGELDAAEETLLKALSLNPNPAYAHYELGRLYEMKKEFDKAVSHYREGIESLGFKAGCATK